MPAVVREYIKNDTFEGTLDIQHQLLNDYKEDIRKYAEGVDQTRILNVFEQIPVQLGKDNKKFQISKVAKGARFGDYRGCIEWLRDAGIINICYCMNFPELPLKGNYSDSKYKLYFFVRTQDSLSSSGSKSNKWNRKVTSYINSEPSISRYSVGNKVYCWKCWF